MTVTLATLTAEILFRLGDTAGAIWTDIPAFIKQGYDDLTDRTGCIWEMDFLDDVSGQALYDLPDDFGDMERVTWNFYRIDPIQPRTLEAISERYETITGKVDAYLMRKDGLRVLRKWRIPAGNATNYTYSGTFGTFRRMTDISTETVTGTFGFVRRIPGQFPIRARNGFAWGIVRHAFQDTGNTRIEFARKGQDLDTPTAEFELPDRYVKYIRHFAMAKAYGRQGPGQSPKLAEHYRLRYEMGIARMMKRMHVMQALKSRQMGGEENENDYRMPRPRLPWRFGTTVRFE